MPENNKTAPQGVDESTLNGWNCLQFDLPGEASRMREESAFQGSGRAQKMLVKGPGMRMAIVVMKAGNQWTDHKTASRISVQPISGSIRFKWQEGEARLGAGGLLVLDSGIVHSVEALEDSAFLLTLS